jgi:hypothetical protein
MTGWFVERTVFSEGSAAVKPANTTGPLCPWSLDRHAQLLLGFGQDVGLLCGTQLGNNAHWIPGEEYHLSFRAFIEKEVLRFESMS